MLEAEYISVMTKIPYGLDRQLTTNNTSPCPFLSMNGECSIYQYRPMTCRLLHALGDPDNCLPGRTQAH